MIPKWLAAAGLAGIAGIGGGGVLYLVRPDGYDRDFLPMAQFLESKAAPDVLIDGSGILIYRLPQTQVEYDRLIRVSGDRTPDFVVLDKAISQNIDGMSCRPVRTPSSGPLR